MLITQRNGYTPIERKSKLVFPELTSNTTFTNNIYLNDYFLCKDYWTPTSIIHYF